MVDPRRVHLIAIKHVMRYLKGIVDYGLKYVVDSEISLLGYLDSYWVVVLQTKKVHWDVASLWDPI
jgi:hypothetical protein